MYGDMHTVELSESEIELINMLRTDRPDDDFAITISRAAGHITCTVTRPPSNVDMVERFPVVTATHPDFDEAWFDMTPPELREPIDVADEGEPVDMRQAELRRQKPMLRIVRNDEGEGV